MGTKKINKPADLPDCLIIDTLIEKSNSKNNYDFGYIASLEELRKKVSIEVSRINELFPEYTPHDETYHLKRLFFIADQLLGEELIRSMNVTELFLLSVSLYAHDWGMAVSEAEKEAVLNGCEQRSDLSLLDDEKYRIGEFCKSRNIGIGNIGQDEWREYVRLTHAFRSGKRVKSHFETVNSGIGECAASICEGHWLDFSKIEDHHSYPVDATVNRDIVNVRALAIYVRLVDLLDLGEDRTPFVLWKFVAPRNAFSKMEWAKHRCLRPVTFPSYQNHRCVKVEGSTDDHNVYMSIMDLKRYADDQFRRSSDILNRTNHGYHKLDISHIEWCIIPRGFEPVPVQFEFDRNRMFDILGDEIYRGDPYVFVRELLQNAIDAIRMRSEILERKDLTLKPRIAIQVTESEDGYMVEVSDNGIGMDEYIIKNYLSVAGKSYYRSCDFEREGLKMDPISRFGIGILSCFMVADRIDICTCKDSYTTTKPEQFKISIPAKENYFKISRPAERLEIGTTFKVFVHKSKLPKEEKTGKTIDFDVTEYLKRTAGFVKYPIYITDRGVETTIYDPDTQPLPGENAHSLQYAYDFEKAFPPQFVSVAKEYFVEKRYHLRDDLKMSGYD
ncbi:HD domain-containing protein [Coprobacter sp.]